MCGGGCIDRACVPLLELGVILALRNCKVDRYYVSGIQDELHSQQQQHRTPSGYQGYINIQSAAVATQSSLMSCAVIASVPTGTEQCPNISIQPSNQQQQKTSQAQPSNSNSSDPVSLQIESEMGLLDSYEPGNGLAGSEPFVDLGNHPGGLNPRMAIPFPSPTGGLNVNFTKPEIIGN